MSAPRILDYWLHVAQHGYPAVIRYHERNQTPKIIVIHIQEGWNFGSWQHFHAVKASSTVLIGKNGDIWRLVDESKSPWTNGDVNLPSALGRSMINAYGSDPNTYSLTIEVEGFSGDAVPKAQLDSIVWQVKEWQRKYNIPTARILKHADFNSVSRPNCPGNALFNMVISSINTGSPVPSPSPSIPTQYAIPVMPLIDGKAWDGSKTGVQNGVTFSAEKRIVTTSGVLNRRQWASSESQLTGAAHAQGTKVNVLGWCIGENVNGENRWWIAANGERLWVGGTVENPTQSNDVPKDDKGTLVVDGVTFKPVTGKYRLNADTNVRQWATKEFKILRTLPAGTIIEPMYEVQGETVSGVNRWFVPDEKAIREGGRIWSGSTVKVC